MSRCARDVGAAALAAGADVSYDIGLAGATLPGKETGLGVGLGAAREAWKKEMGWERSSVNGDGWAKPEHEIWGHSRSGEGSTVRLVE